MTKQKSEEKGIVAYDDKRLAENAKVGMSKVDPEDIRPPKILLMQKSSKLDDFITTDGKQAKIGDYFHTGKLEIYKTFKCYILFAAKNKYIDKRKPEEGEKYQYRMVAVLADDFSLFAMIFRSSSLYTLSGLFTASASTRRPMYSFLCEMEIKKLSGEKGDWLVPALRIRQPETDSEKLILLEDLARGLDLKSDEILGDDDREADESLPESEQ